MINKTIFSILALFIVFSNSVSAVIIETNEISDVKNYVTNDSVVLLNITGTLYEPAMTLADNQWRIYFSEKVNSIISDKMLADRFINKIKNNIVNNLPKKAVEEYTPQLINDWQTQKIPVFGITQKQMAASYADNFGLITRNHLLSIGINLENTLSYTSLKDSDETNHSFAYALIFSNRKPVGPAIIEFLDRLENKPSKIIMVDNSLISLENTEEALSESNIPFVGFRYGRSDRQKDDFDFSLGKIQFFAFMNQGQILSDEQAAQIKQLYPEVDYNSLLDNYIIENSKFEEK